MTSDENEVNDFVTINTIKLVAEMVEKSNGFYRNPLVISMKRHHIRFL